MLPLKIAAAVLCITLLVPLAILGMTGSWRHALFAWRRYLYVMALIVVPAAAFGLFITFLP